MAEHRDTRDQQADLRQRAIAALAAYSGGFADLRRVTEALKAIIFTLDDLLEEAPWTQTLITHWGRLEIPYAVALSENRQRLGPDDEHDVAAAVADLLGEFRGYAIPLRPDDKPRLYDVVRLRNPLAPQPGEWPWGSQHEAPTGLTGAVVEDFSTEAWGELPAQYIVEFTDDHGNTLGLLDVSQTDLDVVWRPGYSPPTPPR